MCSSDLGVLSGAAAHTAEGLLSGGLPKFREFLLRGAGAEIAEEIPDYVLAVASVMRQQDVGLAKAMAAVNKQYEQSMLSVDWADPASKLSVTERVGAFMNQFSVVMGASDLALQAPSVQRRVVARKFGLKPGELSHDDVSKLSTVIDGLDELKRNGMTSSEYKAALKTLDRKSTRLNSSHVSESRMPSSA